MKKRKKTTPIPAPCPIRPDPECEKAEEETLSSQQTVPEPWPEVPETTAPEAVTETSGVPAPVAATGTEENAPDSKTLPGGKFRLFYRKLRSFCPLFTVIGFFLFLAALICHILAVNITGVADFINEGPASLWRFLLAKITGILPFSLAEMFIVCLPLLIGLLIVLAVIFARKKDPKYSRRYASVLVGIVFCFYAGYVFTLGTSYFTSTIDRKLDLDKKDVSAEELYQTALLMRQKAEEELDFITFGEDGGAVMPYSFRELNEKLNDAYAKEIHKYPFLTDMSSHVKNILLSEPMSHTHVSGVYAYPTGEANVNTAFPEHGRPFTMAHEMAHQRGIGREDEANFVAFLITKESDDPFIRYSCYIDMVKYFINALSKADSDLFNQYYRDMDTRMVEDIRAYNRFFDTHPSGTASNISGTLNDTYQKWQGIEAGIQSYGLVVDLAVAYCKENGQP